MKNKYTLLVIGILVVALAVYSADVAMRSETKPSKPQTRRIVTIENEVSTAETTEYRASVSVEPVFPDSEDSE